MARRRLVSDAAWAELMALATEDRDLMRHYVLSADDLSVLRTKRSPANRLGQALVLCAMRHPGRALGPNEVPPPAMLAFVAEQLDVEPAAFADYAGRAQTRREQLAKLMVEHGYRSFGRAEAKMLLAWLTPIAQTERRPRVLVARLIEELRRRRILLPPPLVIERVVHHARTAADRVTHRALGERIDAEQAAALEALLVTPADGGLSCLAWLRQHPSAPAVGNFKGLLNRLAAVRALGLPPLARSAVPEPTFATVAADGLRITVQHLRDLADARRRATLVALVLHLETELTDAALSMFEKMMGGLARKAERRTTETAAATLREMQVQLRLLAKAGRAVVQAHETDRDAFDAVEASIGWARFLRAVSETEAMTAVDRTDLRAELIERWPAMRHFSPALLQAFTFEGGRSVAGLLRGIAVLQHLNATGGQKLPEDAPTSFIRKSWRPWVLDPEGRPDRRAWEVCLMSELRDRLRAGDIWVRGSRRFRRFDTCLMPEPSFAALRAEGPLPIGVPETASAYLEARRDALRESLAEVAEKCAAGTLEDVCLEDGILRITPLKAQTPPEALALTQAAYDLVPRIKVTDLLLEVDASTGFSECFTHQRSGRPADDRTALLTAILADGINLGLTRMAEASRGPSLRQLAWAHDWHIREDCYAEALARLIDAHRALPLAQLWGDGASASSDGQFFRAGGRGEVLGDINARHGKEPGVSFYTHVSDQYGPFHTKVIAATASEAPHVLDGLLEHQSGLRIAEHYTDTGGATDHVFALLALLGFRFAPRLRDLKDRRFYVLPEMRIPAACEGLIGGRIDSVRIEAHWDEVLRLTVSIGAGHVSASEVLKKLAAFPRTNSLAWALREIGRLERTLFALTWLREPDLRRRASAGLNKGEARNALARAVFFHRLGELRDRSFENQVYRASGLNLLIAAIILWNTRYLQAAFDALAAEGTSVPATLIRHAAPLAWDHIGLTGDYVWTADKRQQPGELRPLRRASSFLAA